jgi:hypothetical protein
MMKPAITLIAAALITLSCMNFKSEILLNKDGSGVITYKYLFNDSQFEQLALMYSGESADDRKLSPEEIKTIKTLMVASMVENYTKEMDKMSASFGEGITSTSCDSVTEEDSTGVRMMFTYKDINKIRFYPFPDSTDRRDSTSDPDPLIYTFKYNKKQLVIQCPEKDSNPIRQKDLNMDINQYMKILKSFKFSSKVILNDQKIRKTSALQYNESTIDLFSLNLESIMKQENWKELINSSEISGLEGFFLQNGQVTFSF